MNDLEERVDRVVSRAGVEGGGVPTPDELPEGPDRYLEWIDAYLGLELSQLQEAIIRAVREHRKVLVVGANGPGKTYAVTAVALAFLMAETESKVLATSGTYGKLRRTLCRPLERLHREAKEAHGISGSYKKAPPRIEFDRQPERFFEATRPRDAGELEGTHAPHLLSIVDEADKENVTEDVLDSMASLLTDERDRMIVVANPPRDRANVVADLMDDDAYHTIRVSAFQSRNVLVEAGEVEAEPIDGLISLAEIRENWESWNREKWRGVEAAARAHVDRDDLDVRWYRRRAGVIPPDGASTYRPFSVSDVDAASERAGDVESEGPVGYGIDVARAGGDYTVVASTRNLKEADGHLLTVDGRWRGSDHNENESRIRASVKERPIAIDAQGEGSALADRIQQAYRRVRRFNAGATATAEETYYDCWAEGLALLGDVLRNGGVVDDRTLREELLVAARVIEYEERHLDSRGRDGATVLKCTPKQQVKDQLGRSPDCLDAALMACWVAETNGGTHSMWGINRYL